MIQSILSFLWSQWSLLVGVGLFAIYKWLTATYDFFEKKNVPYDKPVIFFGNMRSMVLRQESMFDMFKRFYMKYKDDKYYGMFEMRNPSLMIASPEMIKQITIKDFDYFLNHRVVLDVEDEPLFGNSLFALKDQKWKDMRATLSPAFTGSKMRLMFQLVDECGHNASKFLKSEAKGKGPIEMELKDFFTRFTNDVVATCAFGIQINSLLEKDNQFYHMSRKATNFSGIAAIKFFMFSNFHKIMKLFKLKFFDEKFSKYFYSLVLDTMQERTSKGIIRPDMINLLMEARKGILEASDIGKSGKDDGFAVVQESTVGQKVVNHIWTDDDLVAQCFVFFVAGFETSSVLMCFCAHELMENPDVQQKLIEEIDQVREELGDKPLTYEVLQRMQYMDMVISETLRKWPPAIATDRVCNKPYVVGNKDGEGVKLYPGDIVSIPIVGLHHDPEYFPNPDKFDPERFSPENKNQIQPFTYLPFGVGPRNCIGSRFALMETKAIIFYLLSEFTFEASPRSCIPISLDKTGFQLKPEGGFWMSFKPRE
ncbi:probable cytochrome P450 9f2 isoform X5 [Hermetia illucens]|uniref:probable cytochrome P450 9f2 isoform X5 n=1 Tax=Hermetia illucens TaxID=343691 RepID=UPI0018CC0C76|nr:probable cytochrome P450 9f2 isoform X5 [Hermetia illucens]